jgi:hypothetical protein
MADSGTPAGWYQDPAGQGDGRYWNGTAWTDSVNRGGVSANVPIDPAQAQQAPFPGTQVQHPVPVAAPYVPRPVTVVASPPTQHSPIAAILGVVAIIFFVILMVIAISDGSSEESPETEPTATPEAPAEG